MGYSRRARHIGECSVTVIPVQEVGQNMAGYVNILSAVIVVIANGHSVVLSSIIDPGLEGQVLEVSLAVPP